MHEFAKKCIGKIYIIRYNDDGIWVHIDQKGALLFSFSKIFVVVVSRILLHRILQSFACNMLVLKDDIDVVLAGIA